MTFTLPDSYWDRKMEAYMHDPFDKVFNIPNHEERAAEILEIFGLQASNEKFWKDADHIASGLERGTVPSYNKNSEKSGAVDFFKNPIIKHPTGTEHELRFELPENAAPETIFENLLKNIDKFIGKEPGKGGYSERL